MNTDGEPLFSVSAESPNVHTVRFANLFAGWEQWGLLRADAHHDNLHSRWDIEKRDLDLAKERNAFIIDVGDLFCAMQGKYDKRSSKFQLRPEHCTDKYLDALVDTAAPFYGPYAKNFLVFGRGNHETSIVQHHGVDLTDRLVYKLNSEYGGNCFAGGFGGWVRFMFSRSAWRGSKRLKYFHGAGSTDAPVTRGVIQTNRQAVMEPDADILVNGHNHEQYYVPIARERLSQAGVISRDILHCVRTGTYKDEFRDGAEGWHVETGKGPKPIGAVWLRFLMERQDEIRIEITPVSQ